MTTMSGSSPTRQAEPRERTSGYAPVSGLRTYYEIHGSGMPAVFLHSAWGHASWYPTLTANRRWICIDAQGHGRTADIDRPLTFEQMADDVAALLRHLQIERADLFGESFGGTIALNVAVRHPEVVRRVATYGSPFGPFQEAFRPDPEALSIAAGDEAVRFQREQYERVAPDASRWPAIFGKVRSIAWAGFSPDALRSIEAPLLIAVGDHDFLRLEHSVETFRRIPRAQLAVIPDAGHFVLSVEPEKLLPVVATFLDAPLPGLPFATQSSGFRPGTTR